MPKSKKTRKPARKPGTNRATEKDGRNGMIRTIRRRALRDAIKLKLMEGLDDDLSV